MNHMTIVTSHDVQQVRIEGVDDLYARVDQASRLVDKIADDLSAAAEHLSDHSPEERAMTNDDHSLLHLLMRAKAALDACKDYTTFASLR